MISDLIIRESNSSDLHSILAVERAAFGSEEEAELVRNLLNDSTAEPRLSLLAFQGDKPVGHIVFSRAVFNPAIDIVGSILGPLAVVPDRQKTGIGGKLIEHGLEILKEDGVNWVFVLGHESYYPRFGFKIAQKQGFQPPFPFPSEYTNAWMAMPLVPSNRTTYEGRVIPADTFNHHRYWGG